MLQTSSVYNIHVSFQDRHALGEYELIIDESQDVTLLAANQNDTHTILRFSRPYVTCDENDMDITVNINLCNVYLQFQFFYKRSELRIFFS